MIFRLWAFLLGLGTVCLLQKKDVLWLQVAVNNPCFFQDTEPLEDVDPEFSNNIHSETLKIRDFQEVKK